MPTAIQADWTAIRKACEKGATYSQVAKDYGVSHEAIMKRSSREGWRGSRSRVAGNVAAALLRDKETLKSTTALMVAQKTSEKVSSVIADVVSDAVRMSREIMGKSHAAAMAADTSGDLKNAAIAFGISHQHTRLALGMDKAEGGRMTQPWMQPANVIDIQTVKPSAPTTDVKPIDV